MAATARRDRGATLPIVALLLPVLMLMTAFAVDLGQQRADRRSMQAAADVIALDMGRVINSRTLRELDADHTATQVALSASASRNGLTNATVTSTSGPRVTKLEWGTINASTRAFQPMLPSGPTDALWDVIPEAVRITTTDTTTYQFRPGSGTVTRQAVAAPGGTPYAGFTVGSRLASLDTQQSRLLNFVLSALFDSLRNPGPSVTGLSSSGPATPAHITGADAPAAATAPAAPLSPAQTPPSGINLSLLDYQGLAGANVTLSEIAVQLGAGSPELLLGTSVGLADFYVATADVLRLRGNTVGANVLELLALQVDAALQLPIGDLLDVAVGAEDAAVGAGLDVFGLVTSSLFLLNGDRTVDVPNLDVAIPGLVNLGLRLHVIEQPRWVFGPVGTWRSTSQIGVELTPRVTLPLNIALAEARVDATLPITVSVGGARAELTAIDCATPRSIDLAMNAQPISTTVGVDLEVFARLLFIPVPLLTVRGTVGPIQSMSSSVFDQFAYTGDFLAPVGTGTMRTAPPTDLGLGSLISLGGLQSLQVDVLELPLGWALSGLLTPVVSVVNPLLGLIETVVLRPLLNALGLQLGGGDMGALDLVCPQDQVQLVG